MKKLLTGLALVLMLAGCTEWTSADIDAAQRYCANHGGLRHVSGAYVRCNDGTLAHISVVYADVYKGSRL